MSGCLGKITQTRWLNCVECHNTVFGSKRSAICAQAVYYSLHSTMPSVMCLRLSDASVICRVSYFQFPMRLHGNALYKPTTDIMLTCYFKHV